MKKQGGKQRRLQQRGFDGKSARAVRGFLLDKAKNRENGRKKRSTGKGTRANQKDLYKRGSITIFSIQKKCFIRVTDGLNIHYDLITLCLIFPSALPRNVARFAPQCFRRRLPSRSAAAIFRGHRQRQKCLALLSPSVHLFQYTHFRS